MIILLYTVSSQTSCTPGIRDIDIDQPPNTETVRFLQSSSTSQEGRQVIVPKMRLDCSGYITNWSAHTLILTEPNFLDSLTHTITFQVWRPDSRNTNSYSLVGSNELRFGGAAQTELRQFPETTIQLFSVLPEWSLKPSEYISCEGMLLAGLYPLNLKSSSHL